MTDKMSPRMDSVLTDKRYFRALIVNTLTLQDAVSWELISTFDGPLWPDWNAGGASDTAEE
jgi:hypothetical protein